MLRVSLGIDVEPDCPPYLATQYRGVTDGLPRILDALDGVGIPTTCFCTGEVAERFPDRVHDLIARGHELASHGHTHRAFDSLPAAEARNEIATSARVLRSFGQPVTSFRAPYLRFPDRYLAVLQEHDFVVDSSQAKYKPAYYRSKPSSALTRIPASITSSVLRLPRWVRDPWLAALESPVVLFVHPWEFVDLSRERLRLDCRFGTGTRAIQSVLDVVALFAERGAAFLRMNQLQAPAAA